MVQHTRRTPGCDDAGRGKTDRGIAIGIDHVAEHDFPAQDGDGHGGDGDVRIVADESQAAQQPSGEHADDACIPKGNVDDPEAGRDHHGDEHDGAFVFFERHGVRARPGRSAQVVRRLAPRRRVIQSSTEL
jgi:hypothetical protein